ncbi:hypothetical protein Ppa06_57490 [Planomonospora parontospora subsp. parontospora]|uniref:Uncharacterized protein n=2 Tax=Planomonospora parontospora TaxID=58119 RepID=A0AA37F791_9ACTN|nr:hypothetical protein [Planomonospora parontospora]GGK90819.1 hypothetical protein GCM10010126_57820 [Planomonospora parontospora]GII11951.1 hypothetical protein Ppa06_57490 [Planomonospora parontospora subsp. parontospora]
MERPPSDDSLRQPLFIAPGENPSPPSRSTRSPKRIKAPTWTGQRPLTIRMWPIAVDRLTVACEQTGLGRKGVIQDALTHYFDRIGVPTDLDIGPDRPRRDPATRRPRKGVVKDERETITVRADPIIDARLTKACEMTGLSPQGIYDDALDPYFDLIGIPVNPENRLPSEPMPE